MMRPFSPGDTVQNITISSSSQRIKLLETASPVQVRIVNDGTATVWVRFGSSAVTVTSSNGLALPAGAVEVLTVPAPVQGEIHLAAIAAGSTGIVNVALGAGI
jgi:hypothetical protein